MKDVWSLPWSPMCSRTPGFFSIREWISKVMDSNLQEENRFSQDKQLKLQQQALLLLVKVHSVLPIPTTHHNTHTKANSVVYKENIKNDRSFRSYFNFRPYKILLGQFWYRRYWLRGKEDLCSQLKSWNFDEQMVSVSTTETQKALLWKQMKIGKGHRPN